MVNKVIKYMAMKEPGFYRNGVKGKFNIIIFNQVDLLQLWAKDQSISWSEFDVI